MSSPAMSARLLLFVLALCCLAPARAAVALLYSLRAIDDPSLAMPSRLLLFSPAIGVSRLAAMSNLMALLAPVPGLETAAWLDVFDSEPLPASSPLQEEVVTALKEFHGANPLQVGQSREEIRSRYFRRESGEIFRFFLEDAVRRNRLRIERDLVALHGHRVSLQGPEAGVSRRLEEAFRAAGLNPPELERAAADMGLPPRKVEEIFFLLVKQGVLVRIQGGMVFHREALEGLKRRIWEYRGTSETIDIAAFKELSGTTRKSAIPLLEHLDSLRVTRRDGNLRRILPPPPGFAPGFDKGGGRP